MGKGDRNTSKKRMEKRGCENEKKKDGEQNRRPV